MGGSPCGPSHPVRDRSYCCLMPTSGSRHRVHTLAAGLLRQGSERVWGEDPLVPDVTRDGKGHGCFPSPGPCVAFLDNPPVGSFCVAVGWVFKASLGDSPHAGHHPCLVVEHSPQSTHAHSRSHPCPPQWRAHSTCLVAQTCWARRLLCARGPGPAPSLGTTSSRFLRNL